METRRTITTTALAAVAASTLLLTGCAAEPGTSIDQADGTWGDCDTWVKEMNEFPDLNGIGEITPDVAERLQCATMAVPLDYTDPDGRKIELALSRLTPERDNGRFVLTNPGGPGIAGRAMPVMIAQSGMSDLAKTSTLIGIDVRGTGGSTTVPCSQLDGLEFLEATSDELAKAVAAANTGCVGEDEDFFKNLTTQNVAQDLNRVREMLGADSTDYFGVSWGTELGAVYASEFPEHVDRVLLDSMTDLNFSAEQSLNDVVAASLKFSATEQEGPVAEEPPVEDVPEAAEASPADDEKAAAEAQHMIEFLQKQLGSAAKVALTCNAYQGATDPEAQKTYLEHRVTELGAEAETIRPAHPLGMGVDVSTCTGWPIAPESPRVQASDDVAVTVVGHARERVTPVTWAENASEKLGGELVVLDDDKHGSLVNSGKAAAAVDFLTQGKPMAS